jgi:hypothetical protein
VGREGKNESEVIRVSMDLIAVIIAGVSLVAAIVSFIVCHEW